ncbi:hypothetical protein CBER1_02780 [Cercospora berteroae]|uniref:Arrestin C-terminal-like domain-containing protein n=1 Tax=Cercospora berteroae TaxID=357750 RepID=A0A2S6CBW8_9PEZI|nr:hypothetical protein CBER1_02780 [Cercospora berteroae]
MAASYRSSTYGLLYYDPAQHRTETDKPQRVYRPRRVGPGRVCIKSVDPRKERDGLHVPYPNPNKETTPLKRESFNLKLASTRENARRFLKSVISSTPASEAPADQQKKDNAWKRRSWSPIQRSNSNRGSEAGSSVAGSRSSSTTDAPASVPEVPTPSMRGNLRHSIAGPINAHLQRPRLSSVARDGSTPSIQSVASSNGSTGSPRIESSIVDSTVIPNLNLDDEKPIVAGNGVAVGIHLAEPVLFLQGFENSDNQPGNTAMLRGGLHLRVSKSAKIKGITLKFKGTAVTKWPEGIPPRKVEFEERDTIMSHTWPFFNAQFESAERGTNADHVQLFKDGVSSTVTRLDPLGRSSETNSSVNLNSRDAKKLALSVNQSRSFGKGESAGGPSVAAKGYRTFLPGDYVYNFEMPIDSRLPETIDVELGSVKYELEAVIERSGAFRSNLLGTKEVTIIRAPAEGSLECVEPIAISRNWEDQLHYDIVISGKSFPLGTQVPIAFKLTPLAKVQCHRIKVLVTENIEYFCSNKRVHRMEPTRKVQLFEKRADGAPTSTFPGSTMRVTSGGGIPHNQRAAAARGEHVIPSDTTNLLGNLDGGDAHIGPTEMEFNVQLPSCHTMKERDRTQRLHFDTTYQNIQVHHWIKIVMRLSKPDVNDPTKRRHFEISIDSPFHILSCRATQQNISLPAYTSPESGPTSTTLTECGCPGAALRRNSPSNLVPALQRFNGQQQARQDSSLPMSPGLTRPPTVHARDAHIGRPQSIDRPIHLLRAPSFNPPPFSDEEPPPPLITPPPQYDSIASPTSGLADYFARLSDAYEDDSSGDESRPGRVNVPLTPGGRINRSVDLGRGWAPLATQMPLALPRREV